MNHLKHGLAAALALLALGLARALPVSWATNTNGLTWGLNNFDTAQHSDDEITIAEGWQPSELKFRITEGSPITTSDGTRLTSGVKLVLEMLTFAVIDKNASMTPFIQIKQGDKVIAQSTKLLNRVNGEGSIHTSATQTRDVRTWEFKLDNPVQLELNVDYSIIFTNADGESLSEIRSWDERGLVCKRPKENTFANNNYEPFIIMSGEFHVSDNPGGVPEPTSLALLALGGASVLLRRPKP